MDFIYTLFGTPLGYIMWACYAIFQDIGIAIIVFTLIVKIATFPLSLKQQKNTVMSQLFMPRVKEIQAKYRNNQQKLAEETAKLQKEGYNPAGGCLPMILTLVILFGVLDVVYKPMTYFERMDKTDISIVKEVAHEIEYNDYEAEYNEKNAEALNPKRADFESEEAFNAEVAKAETKRADELAKFEKTLEAGYKALQGELRAIGVYKNHPEAFIKDGRISGEVKEKLKVIEDKIMFLGIDFSQKPTLVPEAIVLIPILSFIFSVLQTIIMQFIQNKSNPEMNQQMGAMKYMMYAMPLFSLWVVFQFPAGVGFYWTISSVFGIAQSWFIYKVWSPEKLKAEARELLEKRNAGIKFETEVVVVKETKEGVTETTKKKSEMSSKEMKEYNRKKLEAARKADLEKYGEVGVPALETSETSESASQDSENSENDKN